MVRLAVINGESGQGQHHYHLWRDVQLHQRPASDIVMRHPEVAVNAGIDAFNRALLVVELFHLRVDSSSARRVRR